MNTPYPTEPRALSVRQGDRQRPGAVFGPETFVERVCDGALVPLAAAGGNPGRRDLEVIRANETMLRAVAVFVGRVV